MSRPLVIPTLIELPAPVRRIILHHSGGTYTPNAVDKNAYHYLLGGEGTVYAGKWPVAANMRQLHGSDYAAHCGGFNSYSVGIAFCGERDRLYALTRDQVEAGIRFLAECCLIWHLDPRDPAQLFTHREAWTIHRVKGKTNDTKVDISRLFFRPELGPDNVGPWLRSRVASLLAEYHRNPPPPHVIVPCEVRP